MKKLIIVLVLAASFFMLGLTVGQKDSGALIPKKEMIQVGIIVENIEEAAEQWTLFLGLEAIPEISTALGSELNPTTFRGEPSNATARLAFFNLDNISIELIEPDGQPSTWQEFLDNRGPGIHHIAFNVEGMDRYIENFEAHGIPLIQHGGWDTGEYSYMDGSENLALIIELLESYK